MATAPALERPGPGTVSTDRSFFGHPRGLSTLFFSEMWERFSYYGMRGFLILYMTAPLATRRPGARHRDGRRPIYGTYTSMVYLMSLPGGWIADRLIGQRRAVLYGGILIAAGHFSLAVPADGDVLPRPAARRARHRPAQAEHQRHRRPALRAAGHPARRGVFDLLHGHQPRRVPRSARHRLPGAGRRLPRADRRLGLRSELGVALGIRRGRRRHDARPDSVRAWRPARSATAGLHPAQPDSPGGGREDQAAGDDLWLGGGLAAPGRARRRHRHGRAADHVAAGHRRATATSCSSSRSAFFAWLFCGRQLDAGRAQAALRDRRLLRRRRAVLVGVRAGRIDAQPVRRSQHATTCCRSRASSRAAGGSRSTRSSSSSSRRCSRGCGSSWASNSRRRRRSSRSA